MYVEIRRFSVAPLLGLGAVQPRIRAAGNGLGPVETTGERFSL
jgi:hypothetical protein